MKIINLGCFEGIQILPYSPILHPSIVLQACPWLPTVGLFPSCLLCGWSGDTGSFPLSVFSTCHFWFCLLLLTCTTSYIIIYHFLHYVHSDYFYYFIMIYFNKWIAYCQNIILVWTSSMFLDQNKPGKSLGNGHKEGDDTQKLTTNAVSRVTWTDLKAVGQFRKIVILIDLGTLMKFSVLHLV